jgi:hypothetical protein
VGLFNRTAPATAARASAGVPRCLQCGVLAPRAEQTFCRRCGLPYGEPPRADADLPMCPICYRVMDEDGRVPSHGKPGRLDLVGHMAEHDRYPVGDDDFLETLRQGDRIRIGRHYAPFDLVRRYLVTGALEGGRRRAMEHTAIVTAMKQVARWGNGGTVIGDQAEWVDARAAVTALMDRYHARRA